MEKIVRRHYTFTGWVQGVGFRYRCRHAAAAFGCTGWVCNESDGSVTLEIQGTPDAIDRVLEAVERGTFIRIERMECREMPADAGERGFVSL